MIILTKKNTQKCILATKEEWRAEEREDADDAAPAQSHDRDRRNSHTGRRQQQQQQHKHHPKGARAWYNTQSPPFALWVAGNDNLVDGDKLLRRFEKGREPDARLIHRKVIAEYEHLDVIWAMDAETQIFREVREVLWRTVPEAERGRCRTPKGCEGVQAWVDDRGQGSGGKMEQEVGVGGGDGGGVHEEGESSGSSSEDVSGAW